MIGRGIVSRAFRTLATGIAVASVNGLALAQAERFPERAVKIVMPLPAGTSPDVRLRLVVEHFSRAWGHQAVVENRPGGGGLIGAQVVTASNPDGYTLLAAPSAVFTVLPAQQSLPFDLNLAFIPIGLFQSEPMIIAVSARLGVESLSDLIRKAKSEPNKLVIGTNQAGSLPHLAAKLLVARTGAPLIVLPYATGGTNEAIREIMGGRGHLTIDGKPSLHGAIVSGDLKPLAVMSSDRSTALPSIPAATEVDERLTAVGWVGLFAPRGTPDRVVSKITSDLRAANDDPDVGKRVAQIGSPFRPLYGTDLAKFIIEDQRFWLPLAKP